MRKGRIVLFSSVFEVPIITWKEIENLPIEEFHFPVGFFTIDSFIEKIKEVQDASKGYKD